MDYYAGNYVNKECAYFIFILSGKIRESERASERKRRGRERPVFGIAPFIGGRHPFGGREGGRGGERWAAWRKGLPGPREYDDVTGDNRATNSRDSRKEDKENVRKTKGRRRSARCGAGERWSDEAGGQGKCGNVRGRKSAT